MATGAQPAWEEQGAPSLGGTSRLRPCGTLITKPAEDRGCYLSPRRNDRDHAAIQGPLMALGPELGTLTATVQLELQHEPWMTVSPDSPTGQRRTSGQSRG